MNRFAAAACIGAGFCLYGGTRTMQETVFFSPIATVYGLLLSVVIPIALVSARVVLAAHLRPSEMRRRLSTHTVLAAACFLIGSVASEAWILRDEAAFLAEVKGASATFGRPRAWPNDGCSLVFIPGRGIHGID